MSFYVQTGPLYPPEMTEPMRQELTALGVEDLRLPEQVDEALSHQGTVLVVVNSVCGCAAAGARPAVALALQHSKLPDRAVTVFAGVDRAAVERARSYFVGYPPSSPQMALLRDGKVVFMLQRHDIEGRDPHAIARMLTQAFDQYC
ncbi:MAG: BrxA/BrxB family bacilliredoxin [Candidatus Sumerlaeaceae bacterium]|nr:BrxA/BrxB family bacilliredoxin [Candidatus Sumerlaeaceae bacterium]